jgi:hypothetical protein
MFSLDPLTLGKDGYREIFQVGEALDGQPLVDRQHPHDLLMRLSVAWREPLSDTTALTVSGGPAAEPALGPPVFMHRPSSGAIALAPLSHHTFDSTHIAFGVATAGLEHGRWTVEASAFNAREPDEDRWDLDLGPLDSFAARLWFRPTDAWAVQVSSGRLVDPEELEPGTVVRRTASASWSRSIGSGFAAATFGYGSNAGHDTTRHAVFGEGSWANGSTTLTSRFEANQVEIDRLIEETPVPARGARVGALTFGVARNVMRWQGVEAAVAVNVVGYVVPQVLRETHGRHPASVQVFLRLRPVRSGMSEDMHAAH